MTIRFCFELTLQSLLAQWMTAGGGIMHSEMPALDGVQKGLQFWMNLAPKNKFIEPRYEELQSKDIIRSRRTASTSASSPERPSRCGRLCTCGCQPCTWTSLKYPTSQVTSSATPMGQEEGHEDCMPYCHRRQPLISKEGPAGVMVLPFCFYYLMILSGEVHLT